MTPQATVFLAQFESECGFLDPSDQALAVGDFFNSVVQVDNACLSVFSKGGQLITGPTSLNAFFGNNTFTFDPRVLYDWVNERFIVLAVDKTSATGTYWIAVSQTGDPSQGWFVYHLGMPSGGNGFFPDFPRLGQDRGAIYVFSNKFSLSPENFQFEEWLFLPKQAMYAGQGFSFRFVTGPSFAGQFTDTTQPANVWPPRTSRGPTSA